jgi:hypothetical protein
MRRTCSRPLVDLGGSAFAGFRSPPEMTILAVRWYLRLGLILATWRSCWQSV